MAVRRSLVVALLLALIPVMPGLEVMAASPSPAPSVGPQVPAEAPSAALSPDGEPPVEGIHWRLAAAGPDSRLVPPSVAAWISLIGGRLEGWDGCRLVRGAYGRVGDAVRFQPTDSAPADCAKAAGNVADELRAGLVRAASVSLLPPQGGDSAVLVLRDADGLDLLRFVPDDVGSLADETWQLAASIVDGQSRPAVADLPAVLTFAPAGRVKQGRDAHGNLVGSSGCNGIVGTWQRVGDRLTLRGLETTGAPCASEVATQEAAMLRVLASSDLALDLPPDRLILTDEDTGDRLELVTSAPLEGSTWLLAAIPGQSPGHGTVTLRLDGGVVTGEGPCGPYQGAYETDGRVIRLGDLRGPGVADCTDRHRQRKLLLALGRAALLDRDQPQLRLLDAAGRLVAAFDRPPGP